jgi:8-oxo-dGTP pyrophosphatase MutT (NUDIX family)
MPAYQKRAKGASAPAFISLLRWDGGFGTYGGKVDTGESLDEALRREFLEESGIDLNMLTHSPEPLCRTMSQGWEIFSYKLETTCEEYKALLQSTLSVIEKTHEASGVVSMSMTNCYPTDHDGVTGWKRFVNKNRFHGSGDIEVKILTEWLDQG